MDTYTSFEELKKNETRYEIVYEERPSNTAIIAPHGGRIEPGTTEIARAIAGSEHTFYSFDGLEEPNKNRVLHITSTNIDEPNIVRIVSNSERTVAIHGCEGDEKFLEVGGLDNELKDLISNKLEEHFELREPTTHKGKSPENICNRNKNNKGAQLELSRGLRNSMFQSNTTSGRKLPPTAEFEKFVSSVREAITELPDAKN